MSSISLIVVVVVAIAFALEKSCDIPGALVDQVNPAAHALDFIGYCDRWTLGKCTNEERCIQDRCACLAGKECHNCMASGTSKCGHSCAVFQLYQNTTLIEPIKIMYLEIEILNKEEVLGNQTAAKMPNAFGFGYISSIAARLANAMVSEEKFAGKIGRNLATQIPTQFAEKGISIGLSPIFYNRNVVVLQAEFFHVDLGTLIKDSRGPVTAARLEKLLSTLDYLHMGFVRRQVEANFENKILETLPAKLEETIPSRLLESGGIRAHVGISTTYEIEL